MSNYSNNLVRIPDEIGFLTDYTQTGYTYQGHLVRAVYPIINGVKQKTPRFIFAVDGSNNPVSQFTTMTEFATAFLSEVAPPRMLSSDGVTTVLEEYDASFAKNIQYSFVQGAGVATKATAFKPERYFTKLAAWGGRTVGMTVEQAMAHLAPDFEVHILSYTKPDGTPSGLVYASDADPNGIINGQTFYDGYVTLERVVSDSLASNMYTTNRRTGVTRYMAGPYKDLVGFTAATLPEKYHTKITHNFVTRPNSNSVFVHLLLEDGVVVNNTFVNKQPYVQGDKVFKPSGEEVTPLWVLSLVNGGAPQTSNGIALRAMAQSVVWGPIFNAFNVETTEGDGYIDVETNTVFYNPNHKAILRVELMENFQNNPMSKVWGVEGAINLVTGEWSKFFEQL